MTKCFAKDCNKPRLDNGDVFCEEHYQEWLEFEDQSILSGYDSGIKP